MIKNKKGQIIWLKIIGASAGAVGFILWGVGGQLNTIVGTGLIGIGSVMIAGGS